MWQREEGSRSGVLREDENAEMEGKLRQKFLSAVAEDRKALQADRGGEWEASGHW